MLASAFEQKARLGENMARMSGATIVSVELCKVTAVGSDAMTVDVHRFSTSTPLGGIPVCGMGLMGDHGVIAMPEVGSIGLLATTRTQEFAILGFLSKSSFSKTQEPLEAGDILLQTSGGSFLKQNAAGKVVLASRNGDFITLGNQSISMDSMTLQSRTAARNVLSGYLNGVVKDIELYYDKDITMPTSMNMESLIDSVLSGYDVDIEEPSPVLSIERGLAFDAEEVAKLDVFTDNNPDAVFRMKVLLSDGQTAGSIAVGRDGSISVHSKVIKLSCDTLDLSGVTQITPDLSRWDATV